jgi:Protein of unknown function (DUF3309)
VEATVNTWVVVLLVVLLLAALGAGPWWGHPATANWSYWPSGILGLVLVVVLILALTGRL